MTKNRSLNSIARLAKVRNLYQLRRYQQAIEEIEACSPEERSVEEWKLAARSELERGNFTKASLYLSCLRQRLAKRNYKNDLQLLEFFIEFNCSSNVRKFLKQVESFIKGQKKKNLDLAYAFDLQGRALAAGIGWKIFSSTTANSALAAFEKAADIYWQNGKADDYIGAQLRRALFASSLGKRELAEQIIQKCLQVAEDQRNSARIAETISKIAFLQTEDSLVLSRGKYVEHELLKEAKALFTTLGNELSVLELDLRACQLIGEHGGDLEVMALSVYERCKKLDFTLGIFEITSLLSMYYLGVGNLPKSLQFRQENLKIAEEMDFAAGKAAALFAYADLRMRAAEYHDAVAIYQKLAENTILPVFNGLSRLNLANNYLILGLQQKALIQAKQAQRVFSRIREENLLSQVSILIGNIHCMSQDWSSAIKVLKAGILKDNKQGRLIDAAAKQQLFNQAKVMREYQSKNRKLLAQTIKQAATETNKYISALQQSNLPDANSTIAGLFQSLGQIEICGGNYIEALRYLGKAREGYLDPGLKIQLATTDSMISMVYKELAKKGQSHFLQEAEWHSAQAGKVFKEASDFSEKTSIGEQQEEKRVLKNAH